MKKIYTHIGLILFVALGVTSCDDFIKIDPPRTALVKATVFGSDATANAAMLDIYYQLRTSGFANGTMFSISFLGSLLSDEQINYHTSSSIGTAEVQQFNDNELMANNSVILGLWSDLYKCVYKTNAIIEGLASSLSVTESKRQNLLGEAKFIRALCNFYLVNLWGDVPLIISTNYQINAEIPRASQAVVYQQIIDDLIDAQNLLADNYSFSNGERVRANKAAATALLARTYLYTEDWANAELQASAIITNTAQYSLLPNLNGVTVKNNAEAIFQIWSDYYPQELFTFAVFSSPFYGALREQFVNDFEQGDQRRNIWVGIVGALPYYFSKKYYSFTLAAEFSTVLRLGEQYLIRAEARVQQDNVAGAQEDVNVIRARAGLSDTPGNDKASMLLAIEQERRSELFTEWGHRWLDLKRTGRVDAVLSPLKAQWTSTAVFFPIPESEMINNPSLRNAQNPGY